MIHFDDPPRLLESESTPLELREWLQSAKHWKSSSAEVHSLVRAVDGMAEATHASVEPLMTPQPLAIQGAGVSATAGAAKLLATFVVGLAAAGVGVGGWVSQQHSSPPLSLSHSQAMNRGLSPTQQAPALPSETHEASTTLTETNQRPRSRDATSPQLRVKAAHVRSDSAPKAAREAVAKPAAEAEEWRILHAARRSVSSNPERALALVREHARRFPEGMLGQEREAIAIDALARQGRTDEAKARAQRFSSEFPSSPYRNQTEAAVSRSANAETKP